VVQDGMSSPPNADLRRHNAERCQTPQTRQGKDLRPWMGKRGALLD
jgi:hypothetical protein